MTSKLFTMIMIIAFLVLPKLVFAVDATHIVPMKFTEKKYRSYVDFKNCVATDAKHFVVVMGVGGGNVSQQCPSTHPVMTQWNHNVVYATAWPWVGSVMGAGGKTSVTCCAMGYEWA